MNYREYLGYMNFKRLCLLGNRLSTPHDTGAWNGVEESLG